jgi:class 3 adenylate cyclase
MPACLSCGRDNPEGFQYCGFCSAPLQPALPTQAEERKVVSVLFCDLVGFTRASEAADPEDVRARLRPYHERLRHEVEAFGGVVEKFVGDAVMAVFGAPLAHEDDAERAVRAGLRILEAIDELNDRTPQHSLAVRLGINTGETLVSLGARPERGEAMLAGDVVNTASRLQVAAPTGGLIVGERTYLATKEIFEWEALDPISLKGKSEPVHAWRALAPRARVGADVVSTNRRPLVGRDTDVTILRAAFDKCVAERCVQMVTVGGAPGVGRLASSRSCSPSSIRIRGVSAGGKGSRFHTATVSRSGRSARS